MTQPASLDQRQMTSYEEDGAGSGESRLKIGLKDTLNNTDDSIATFPGDISHVDSGGLAASLQVATAACKVYQIRVFNTAASAQYYQLFDASALPANGTTPDDVIKSAGADGEVTWTFPQGRSFANGCFVCNSSTDSTITIGAADTFFAADYELA